MIDALPELPPLVPRTAPAFPSAGRETPRPGTFRTALERAAADADASAANPAPTSQVIEAGDTLSHIVLRQMKAEGQRPTLPELYARVDDVARANGLANPDLVMPGQQIVFTGASPRAASAEMAETTPPVPSVTSATPRPPQAALTGGIAARAAASPWRDVLDGPARLTSQYGMRTHPISGRRQFHAGVDLAAPAGTPIRAWQPGVVTFSGPQRGYGNTVIVRHANGVETLYAHASRNLVKEGDRVGADTVLGLVGSTGSSTGPHLHFEVRRDGHVLDPRPYLLGAQAPDPTRQQPSPPQ